MTPLELSTYVAHALTTISDIKHVLREAGRSRFKLV